MNIQVQTQAFDMGAEIQAITANRPDIGAVVSFIGLVRDVAAQPVLAMTLVHYPAMTEKALTDIARQAQRRWDLTAVTVIHRVGKLSAGEPIVLVITASTHRQAAFAACEFIMDYLKTRAPFWKKEHTVHGDHWVSAKDGDEHACQRW